MSRVRIAAFSVSLDGFGAGADQDLANPLGVRGLELHEWLFRVDSADATDCELVGFDRTDREFSAKASRDIGAYVLGRNMFGPLRGEWPDDLWNGWWGDVPPFHTEVFVLTHHPRPSVEMAGGTVFHFSTGGIHDALERAKKAAGGKDVRIGGGVATIRQYIAAGLVDEIHLVTVPILLGQGEPVFLDLDLSKAGFKVTQVAKGSQVTHTVLSRSIESC